MRYVITSCRRSSRPGRSCHAPLKSRNALRSKRRWPCRRRWRTDASRCRKAGAPHSPISRQLSSGCTTARTRPRACVPLPKSATLGLSGDERRVDRPREGRHRTSFADPSTAQINGGRCLMKFKSRITEMLGIDYPILQGGMRWAARAELAAAVGEAGGMGFISAPTATTPHAPGAGVDLAKALNQPPFGVNITLFGANTRLDFVGYYDTIID